MSFLQVCIEQIQRPSFLPNYEPATRRPTQPKADAKRLEVLACLRAAGHPVGRGWVVDYTGYTKQSINHILAVLVENGLARRIEGGRVLLWEVV